VAAFLHASPACPAAFPVSSASPIVVPDRSVAVVFRPSTERDEFLLPVPRLVELALRRDGCGTSKKTVVLIAYYDSPIPYGSAPSSSLFFAPRRLRMRDCGVRRLAAITAPFLFTDASTVHSRKAGKISLQRATPTIPGARNEYAPFFLRLPRGRGVTSTSDASPLSILDRRTLRPSIRFHRGLKRREVSPCSRSPSSRAS